MYFTLLLAGAAFLNASLLIALSVKLMPRFLATVVTMIVLCNTKLSPDKPNIAEGREIIACLLVSLATSIIVIPYYGVKFSFDEKFFDFVSGALLDLLISFLIGCIYSISRRRAV